MPVRLDHKILLRTDQKRYFPSVLPARQYSAKEPDSGSCHQIVGDLSERDPPVPIPNTVVKPLSPDGTARVSVWESRKSPGSIYQKPDLRIGLLFSVLIRKSENPTPFPELEQVSIPHFFCSLDYGLFLRTFARGPATWYSWSAFDSIRESG